MHRLLWESLQRQMQKQNCRHKTVFFFPSQVFLHPSPVRRNKKTDHNFDFHFSAAIEPIRTAQSQMWICSAERFPSSVASITPASSSLSGRVLMTPVNLLLSPSTSLEVRCSPCYTSRRGEKV